MIRVTAPCPELSMQHPHDAHDWDAPVDGPAACPGWKASPAQWVLVKGSHESGVIDGVYGPYTEERVDWLLEHFTDGSLSHWTKTELIGEQP